MIDFGLRTRYDFKGHFIGIISLPGYLSPLTSTKRIQTYLSNTRWSRGKRLSQCWQDEKSRCWNFHFLFYFQTQNCQLKKKRWSDWCYQAYSYHLLKVSIDVYVRTYVITFEWSQIDRLTYVVCDFFSFWKSSILHTFQNSNIFIILHLSKSTVL